MTSSVRRAHPKPFRGKAATHSGFPKQVTLPFAGEVHPRITYLGLTYRFIRAKLSATDKHVVMATYRLMENYDATRK